MTREEAQKIVETLHEAATRAEYLAISAEQVARRAAQEAKEARAHAESLKASLSEAAEVRNSSEPTTAEGMADQIIADQRWPQ